MIGTDATISVRTSDGDVTVCVISTSDVTGVPTDITPVRVSLPWVWTGWWKSRRPSSWWRSFCWRRYPIARWLARPLETVRVPTLAATICRRPIIADADRKGAIAHRVRSQDK